MASTTNLVQQRKSKRLGFWILNLVLFTCFVLLSLTGLIPWVILPRELIELRALRHTLLDLHQWIALAFIVLVVVHLVWHWPYIRVNAKRWLGLPVH